MASYYYSMNLRHLYPLPLHRLSSFSAVRSDSVFSRGRIIHDLKLIGTSFLKRCRFVTVDVGDVSPAEDWGNHGETALTEAVRMSFSSDGEDSDAEYVVSPQSDTDLPHITTPNDALTVSAYPLAMLGHQREKHRIRQGVLLNTGLIMFLVVVLLYVDSCA